MGEDLAHVSPERPGIFHVYRIPIALLVASIILIGIALTLFFKTQTTAEPVIFSSDDHGISSVSAELVIDISGGVHNPGVYRLLAGSRVVDAIQKAGGLTDAADRKQIERSVNQAAFLADGMKLYIPVIQSSLSQDSGQTVQTQYISINSASQDELESLSGVGEVTAKKIMDGRPYTAIEELVTKKVISASLFEKLKGQLSL